MTLISSLRIVLIYCPSDLLEAPEVRPMVDCPVIDEAVAGPPTESLVFVFSDMVRQRINQVEARC